MKDIPLLSAPPQLTALREGEWAIAYGQIPIMRIYAVRRTTGFRGILKGIYGVVYELHVFICDEPQGTPLKFNDTDAVREFILTQENAYRRQFSDESQVAAGEADVQNDEALADLDEFSENLRRTLITDMYVAELSGAALRATLGR